MIGFNYTSLSGLFANLVIVVGAVSAGVGAAIAYFKNRGKNW